MLTLAVVVPVRLGPHGRTCVGHAKELNNWRRLSQHTPGRSLPIAPGVGQVLGATPSSEVTELFCRLPSPTLTTVQPEIANLGDLVRYTVRPTYSLEIAGAFPGW
jgi:hypothetical protein